jgi:hypothetical protein
MPVEDATEEQLLTKKMAFEGKIHMYLFIYLAVLLLTT